MISYRFTIENTKIVVANNAVRFRKIVKKVESYFGLEIAKEINTNPATSTGENIRLFSGIFASNKLRLSKTSVIYTGMNISIIQIILGSASRFTCRLLLRVENHECLMPSIGVSTIKPKKTMTLTNRLP